MDPITAAFMAVGLGMQIFGGLSSAGIAKQQSGVQGKIAGYEIQADQQRRQQMELDSQRKSMEVLRNNQRARSQAQQNATNQGAQFGSGLPGGYGQISGTSGVNQLGISQNRQIGENLFDINSNIGKSKMELAQLGGQMATSQAWSSFGGDLGKVAGQAGNLSKGFNFGPSPSGSSFGMSGW